MEETALVPTIPQVTDEQETPSGDIVVLARNPQQMQDAQKALIAWCERKLREMKADAKDLQTNYEIAVKQKWRSGVLKRHAEKAAKKVIFYSKIKAALEAGYCIIPNFPVDIFAIRTTKNNPKRKESAWGTHQQESNNPPIGEGKFVNATPVTRTKSINVQKSDGSVGTEVRRYAADFQDIDFPFVTAKPQILQAAAKAMADKIFDDIGVLPRRPGGDPIIVGRILDRRHPYDVRPITFLIAWFVDTRDI